MLKKLNVKNLAIIEDVSVSFSEGMTVLTGQTGAGKSLIIDSISLLLGARADSDLIRFGATKAQIEGVFSSSTKVNSFLESKGVPVLDELTIYREVSKSRALIKVNDTAVSLVTLKELGLILADIHVQHDTLKLFSKDNYISFIDPQDDNEFNKIFNEYQICLSKYNKSFSDYNEILKKKNQTDQKIDFLEFTYKELSEANIKENEDVTLEVEINRMSNFDKISTSIKEAISSLENEYYSNDNIYNAYNSINKISTLDSEFNELASSLNDAYYSLTDILSSLKRNLDNLDYDENELNSLNERLNLINNLKLKYKMSNNELVSYMNEIKLELELVNDYDNVLSEFKDKIKVSFEELKNSSITLTSFRRKRALEISKAVEDICKSLELPQTRFEISFNEVSYNDYMNSSIFNENGTDDVEFMLSTNLGEPLKHLSKVASGGEMSRIMLAFKTYFAKDSNLGLLVFDEIDSGVSGSVAHQIALRMKEISKYSQVLAITHLPQVAGIADYQYNIYKEESNGRTFTNINALSNDERVISIAKMISGEKVSAATLSLARELLVD